MLFGRKKEPSTVTTPYGEAKRIGDSVCVPWRRHRGVLINLQWDERAPPDPGLIRHIEGKLDFYVDAGLERIGAAEFPNSLTAVLPENIDLSVADGDFELSFYCPDWPDAIFVVVFKDDEIVRHYEGD